MSDLKEQALAKMLEEMNQNHTSAEDRIHNWLCEQDDEELLKGILWKNKSISESIDYCGQKARQMAMRGVAVVDGEEILSWIREYFTTKDLKVEKQQMYTAAVSTQQQPKPSRKKAKKKQPSMPEGEQLDLLSFL